MKVSSSFRDVIHDFDKALEIVNNLEWNISFHPQTSGRWRLLAGDQEIGTFETKSELESFVLGMGLALGVLPEEVIFRLKKLIG